MSSTNLNVPCVEHYTVCTFANSAENLVVVHFYSGFLATQLLLSWQRTTSTFSQCDFISAQCMTAIGERDK